MPTVGAILCGGSPSRFGGHRANAMLGGRLVRSLVRDGFHAADLHAVEELTTWDGPSATMCDPDTRGPPGARFIAGPLIGIISFLGKHEEVLFWPVNRPIVPVMLLRHMAASEGPIFLKNVPLCCKLKRDHIREFKIGTAANQAAVLAMLREIGARPLSDEVVDRADPDALHCLSFHTQEELKALERRLPQTSPFTPPRREWPGGL